MHKPKCDEDRIPSHYGTTTSSTGTASKPLIDALTATTAFAALAAVAAQWVPVDQAGGLASEVVCWGLLAVLFGRQGKRGVTAGYGRMQGLMPSPAGAAGKRRVGGTGAVWMVAAAMAGVGWWRAEGGEVWGFVSAGLIFPSSRRP